MKWCPECGRDYNDDSLSFCLDDGSELLFGPASTDEPATVVLSEPRKAIEQFQQAAADPNYALAYAGLADCYVVLGDYTGAPENDTIPKAQAFAKRALELDGSLVEERDN